MNLRNISWAMGLVLLGSVAMPSLARKRRCSRFRSRRFRRIISLRTTASATTISSWRERASRLPAIIRQLSTSLSMPGRLTRRRLKPISMSRFSILSSSRILALAYMQKAIELNPENQTYAEQLGRYYIGSQKYDLAIDAYENLYAKTTIIPMPSASWFSFIPRIRIINQYSKPFRVLKWKKVKANSLPSLK